MSKKINKIKMVAHFHGNEKSVFEKIAESKSWRIKVPASPYTIILCKKDGGAGKEVTSVTPKCSGIPYNGYENRRITVERSKQGECYLLLHGFRKADEGEYEFRKGSLFGTAIPNSSIHVEMIERHARSGAGLSKSNPVWTIFCSLLALALVSLLCL